MILSTSAFTKKTFLILFGLFIAFFLVTAQVSKGQKGPGYQFYKKGAILSKQKQCGEAINEFTQAIKLEPGNYKYHFAKGKCYYKLKDYDSALISFEETTDANQEYIPAYSLMAKIYKGKKDYDKAIFYYNQAFKFESNADKKLKYKLLVVQTLLKLDKVSEAYQHISEAKREFPKNTNVLYYDAKISNKEGDYERAKNSMLTATSNLGDVPPSKSAKFYYELGLAYNQMGDYANAKKAWDKAMVDPYKTAIKRQLSKNSPKYFYSIAASYYKSNQYKQSEKYLNKAFELQKDFPAGYILLAKMAKARGNFSQAIDHILTASNMEPIPERKTKYRNLALSWQFSSGDYAGAIKSANVVLEQSPNNLTVIYKKAMSYLQAGQLNSAAGTVQDIIDNSSLDAKGKAKFFFILGMATKNTDPDKAKEAFKNSMSGSYKPAAKNELELLKGKS